MAAIVIDACIEAFFPVPVIDCNGELYSELLGDLNSEIFSESKGEQCNSSDWRGDIGERYAISGSAPLLA